MRRLAGQVMNGCAAVSQRDEAIAFLGGNRSQERLSGIRCIHEPFRSGSRIRARGLISDQLRTKTGLNPDLRTRCLTSSRGVSLSREGVLEVLRV